ncbi:hypothetical protein IMSAGC009_01185 [Lachnospiraceae bacterium]|nr:hypothetical protein IMSAGC009_01185 [Lachnospiraceae bacterium]
MMTVAGDKRRKEKLWDYINTKSGILRKRTG